MSKAPFEDIRSAPTSGEHAAALDLYHNTRHASRRHASLGGLASRRAGSPWLARFDWVLDAHPDSMPRQSRKLFLTKRKSTPASVFVKAGKLGVFVKHVLPALEHPVVVYVGNSNIALSAYADNAGYVRAHPLVHAMFCENKDLDVPSIVAMPLGVHPVDLLQDDGAARLHGLAAGIDWTAKRARILPLDGGNASRSGAPHIDPDLMSVGPTGGDCVARWTSMRDHRFVLPPWGIQHDDPAPFEALVLGAIPILEAGPLAEAYDGLPVVTVHDPSEITPENLERWWHGLSGPLVDASFASPAYWWAKVAARLPRRKRAFLVLGAESHGNHLVTDLLVHAGCHGGARSERSWEDGWREGLDDSQAWDEKPPTDEDPIVWRRSIPHLNEWPDIRRMVASLERRGYAVSAIVVTRERYAAVRSQLRWRHVGDSETAERHIDRAYPYIFGHLRDAAITPTIVSYEALVHYAEARARLLAQLGLELPRRPFEIWDGNRRRYAESALADRETTPGEGDRVAVQTPASTAARAQFPEHLFPCASSMWPAYEKRVAAGLDRMQSTTAVFCGLARDVARALPEVVLRIEKAAAMFRDYRVVIYESDSCDDTVAVLSAWQDSNPKVDVLSEVHGERRWEQVTDPARMRHLAACRNRYLERVMERYGDCDVVVVFDTDLPRGFSYDGLASTFGYADWDVVASNLLSVLTCDRRPRAPQFFDAWAFRRVGDENARPFAETNKLSLKRGEPWVPVWSAFGGLAVYTMEGLSSGARYGGDDCEHVVLHRSLRERGFDRQFLNPSQIVLYQDAS